MSDCDCDANAPILPEDAPLEMVESALPPTLDTLQNVSGSRSPWVTAPGCDLNAEEATESSGSILETKWTDACPSNGLTLLARIGNRLAKFCGSGFLRVVDGKTYLVEHIPLVVRQFWHDWFRDGAVSRLGRPKTAPYLVVTNDNGEAHLIKGIAGKRTHLVSDPTSQQWVPQPIGDTPLEVTRKLNSNPILEIVGFQAVPVLGDVTAVRDLRRLMGTGVVYLERVLTAPTPPIVGCPECPEDAFTYVAKVLTFPTIIESETEIGRHRLIFSSEGLYWEPEDPEEDFDGPGGLGNG